MMASTGVEGERWQRSTGNRWWVATGVFLTAIVVRGLIGFVSLPSYQADPDAYRAIAETLAQSGVYGLTGSDGVARPTAFRPPLYPFVLSWIAVNGQVLPIAVALLHTVLGAVTVLCTYLCSHRLLEEGHQSRSSLIAATLVMIDPILVQQSTLVMTETMATAIVSVVLWWWVRRASVAPTIGWAVVLGVLLTLAFLCRPTFLVWAVLVSFSVALANPNRSAGTAARIGRGAIVMLIVTVGIAGWAARNSRSIGHPVWATTHGGYTLLLGNNPMFYDYLRHGEFGTVWDPETFFVAYSHRYDADPTTDTYWRTDWGNVTTNSAKATKVTEFSDDRLTYEAAKSTIKREPAMFLWSSAVRLYRLWTPLPHLTPQRSRTQVIAVGLYGMAFYVAVAIGLWRLGPRIFHAKWLPMWTLFLTLSVVHAVYWSNMRMRAPAIPVLAIVAAATLLRPKDQQ